jgi:hypothetical protein
MARLRERSTRRSVATGAALSALLAPALFALPETAAAATTLLPVYEVRSTGVGAEQARTLQRALGLKNLARANDGTLRYTDESAFLRVPTVAKGEGRPDEDENTTTAAALDLASLSRLRVLKPQDALARATKALAAAKLTPRSGRPTASHTTFEAVGTTGKRLASVPLDTTVSYSQTLNGLPYEGPGAKVRVAYDGAARVTQLSYATRGLAQMGSVAVVGKTAALQRCAQAFGRAARITAADYAYFAPRLAERVTRLQPSLRCAGNAVDGTPLQRVFVPAALHAKLPALPRLAPLVRKAPGAAPAPGLTPQSYGQADVGSEGTGPCSGLPWTGSNLASFNNQFSSRGIPVEFSWLDQNAWEDDFKDPSLAGHDSNWTDHVDMTYWQGHGSPTGFSFSGCSSTDDTFLANTDARWGNGDVEWMSLFTCLVLANTSGGQSWWQRWGNAFDGLHQLNSFHTVSYHSASHGGTYANYMLRTPFLWWNKPMSVRSAWAQASIDDQPSSVVWATMGPIGAGGMVNLNDYFWGKGNVGPDVPASSRTGWWYISGTS